jgi:tetratricopeptide (TPR) repeat protein
MRTSVKLKPYRGISSTCLRWAVLGGFAGALVVSACGPSPSPSAPPDAAALLARAEELASRHRLAEALALLETEGGAGDPAGLEASWSAPGGRAACGSAAPPSAAEAALRERQASLLLALSRPAEARRILEVLARLEQGSAAVARRLAEAHLDLGEPERALALLEALPSEPSAWTLHARALLGAGRIREAAATLAAALVRDPWLDEAYLLLGRALVRLGEEASAGSLLRRYRDGEGFRRAEQEVLQLEQEGAAAKALHRRGLAEAERGRLYEAMLLFNRTLQAEPGAGEPYLELARLSIFLERRDEAAAVLRKLPPTPAVLELLEAAEEREGAQDPSPEGRALAELRAEVRSRQRGQPLSASAAELLRLAGALERAGRLEEARRLLLFVLRLSPGSAAARRELARLSSRPDEVFIRLWALAPLAASEGGAALEEELGPLGIDAAEVRRWLGG